MLVITLVVALALTIIITFGVMAKLLVRVPHGKALIISKMSGEEVSFTHRIVLPIVHRAVEISLHPIPLVISRRGEQAVRTKDGYFIDVQARFIIRINQIEEDILLVAKSIGAVRATDPQTIQDLFEAKLNESIKKVTLANEIMDLLSDLDAYKYELLQDASEDLNGYLLDDLHFEVAGVTPPDLLNPDNILHAKHIKRAPELARMLPASFQKDAPANDPAEARSQREKLSFLPDPVEPEKKHFHSANGVELRLSPDRLCLLQRGESWVTIDLDAPFQAMLSREERSNQRWLIMELRQRLDFSQLRLSLIAPWSKPDEIEGLHRSQAKGLELEEKELRSLIAALRHCMLSQGEERWGS